MIKIPKTFTLIINTNTFENLFIINYCAHLIWEQRGTNNMVLHDTNTIL